VVLSLVMFRRIVDNIAKNRFVQTLIPAQARRQVAKMQKLVNDHKTKLADTDKREQIVTLFKEFCQAHINTQNGSSIRRRQDFKALVRQLDNLDIIDSILLTAIPFDPELGRGNRAMSKSLAKDARAMLSKDIDFFIQQEISKRLEEEKNAYKKCIKDIENLEMSFDEVLDMPQEKLGQKQIDQMQTWKNDSDADVWLKSHALWAMLPSEDSKLFESKFHSPQLPMLVFDAAQKNISIMVLHLKEKIANELQPKAKSFNDFKSQYAKATKVLDKLQTYLIEDLWEAINAYQLIDENDRKQAYINILDAFENLMTNLHIENPDLHNELALFFDQTMIGLSQRLSHRLGFIGPVNVAAAINKSPAFKAEAIPVEGTIKELEDGNSSMHLNLHIEYQGLVNDELQQVLDSGMIEDLKDLVRKA